MVPDYRIEIDGQDITARLKNSRLMVSLEVVDQVGIESDSVTLVIADPAGSIAMPRQGAEMTVYLGYEEKELIRQGIYIVDTVTPKGPVRTITVKAHAANMRDLLKESKSRSFDNITAFDLVNRIASEHGLQAVVSNDIADYTWQHIDQTDESDMHLLTRLGKDLDAVSKPTLNKWLFVPRGQQKAASGIALPVISLSPTDITDWSATLDDRPQYKSVTTQYQDIESAELKTYTAGTGSPVKRKNRIYANQTEAQAGAEGELKRLLRSSGRCTINMAGRADVFAEGPLNLSGFKQAVDGEWIVKSTRKKITKSDGFKTTIQGELPN
jgi:phage protein D